MRCISSSSRYLPSFLTSHGGWIHRVDDQMREASEAPDSSLGLSKDDRAISDTAIAQMLHDEDSARDQKKAERELRQQLKQELPHNSSNGRMFDLRHFRSPHTSGTNTPTIELETYLSPHKAGTAEKHPKKRNRHQHRDEIYITMHVAAILERQDFILLVARALMLFGGPTHRVEQQLEETAHVLEIGMLYPRKSSSVLM